MTPFINPTCVPENDSTRRLHYTSDDMNTSATTALYRTPTRLPASDSTEAVVGKRKMMFVGFVARTGEERLTQRVMFGQVVLG